MRSFTLLLYCFLLLLFAQCTPRISGYFDTTHYVETFNTHVVNDSLELYLKTGADIRFTRDREQALQAMKKSGLNLDGLIAYGKTAVPPHYEFYLLLNPQKRVNADGAGKMARDTVINGQNLVVVCKTEGDHESYLSDCNGIFNSIKVGEGYRRDMASIFDLTGSFGNRYYQALEETMDYPAKGRSEQSMKLQMAINYASYLAPNPTYDSLVSRFQQSPENDGLDSLIQSEAIRDTGEIFDTILSEASGKRMIMFNENHFYPEHRILLIKLLPRLKKAGFTHFALETLGQGQGERLNAGEAPDFQTGYYTREPHFGELLRRAQELGFIFVNYENFDSNRGREVGQAENLYRRTFGRDDSARVVVLAGSAHILEQPTPDGKSWLGHLMHVNYHIDPLTINQAHLNRYRGMTDSLALLPSSAIDNPILNSTDWLLVNNLSIREPNPNYTYTNPFGQKVQVSLFLYDEMDKDTGFQDLVPYRARLAPAGDTLGFKLPENDYYLVIMDRNGQILSEEKVSID